MALPTLLERREIEARVLAPLVREMMREVGEEKALAILRRTIEGLARDSGAAMAREFADSGLLAFARGLERWKEGGALEIRMLEQTEENLDFNVTRCGYAEMYRRLGLEDLGEHLSCCRDFALIEGFNPSVELTRTQTIMEGADYCDFRFRARPPGPRPEQGDASGQAQPSAEPI